MVFKDLFSEHATDYAKYRPKYPPELFDILAAPCLNRNLAWDCGTGNGQAAIELATRFKQVIATDPSEKQIFLAPKNTNVEYQVAPAEKTAIATESVDLVTVAQALHWFKIAGFTKEVLRVTKPRARLAVWCYSLAKISDPVDAVTTELYEGILGSYWEPERKLVDAGYEGVILPIANESRPKIDMRAEMNLETWLSYLRTWSALQKYQKLNAKDPIELVLKDYEKAWGDPSSVRPIVFPLFVRSGEIVS